jgi:putative membrane protein
MKDDIFTFLKGFAMGAANVIPGVSGGTIAFITGIYERLIEALKGIDITTLKLVCKLQLREAAERVDLRFLMAIGLGAVLSVLTLAQVFKGVMKHSDGAERALWAFFFGLILASLPAVGKMVRRWSVGAVVGGVIGCAMAVAMAFMSPATESDNVFYLMLCGVVAMCSMIIPGLSGSFVLLLMGNYKLVMIDSISALSAGEIGPALKVLVPVGIGAVLGMLCLARFLSWLFRTWHDVAVSSITGFIAGSLVIIWPWKDKVVEAFAKGDEVKEKVVGYENWHVPSFGESGTWLELGMVVVGAGLIVLVEWFARKGQSAPEGAGE